MQIILVLLFILGLGTSSFASDCKAVQWPYSKNVKSIQPLSLQSISRDHLYNYLYFELSQQPAVRTKYLIEKLFYYLKNTEQNDDKYQMLMALEWSADLQTSKPRIIPINEICALDDKIIREPSSAKNIKSKQKTKKK